MANERELLILVKAKDDASRVVKETTKAIKDAGKEVKKTDSEFSKFAKQFVTLGFAFQTLKRIASEIEGLKAFQEAFYHNVGRGIGELVNYVDQLTGGYLEQLKVLQVLGAEYGKVADLRYDIEKLKSSGLTGTPAGANVLKALEAELRMATRIRNLVEQRGLSPSAAGLVAKEMERIDAIKFPLGTGLSATADDLAKVDVFGLLKLDPDAATKARVDDAVRKLRDQFSQSIQAQNLANEIADVYKIEPADAKKIADEISKAVREAVPESIGESVGESFARGFHDAAEDIKAEFADLTRIGEQFAKDLFNTLADNFFRAAKQEFKDFGDFAKSILRGILDSILAILSRLAASQLLSLGGSLFDGLGLQIPGGGQQSTPYSVPGLEGGTSSDRSTINQTFVIHAVDAQSFAEAVQRNPAAIAVAATRGISQNNTLRTNLRGALS